jgi:hypothetical protein
MTMTARKAQVGGSNGNHPTDWILNSSTSEHFSLYKYMINYTSLDKPVEVNIAKRMLHVNGTLNILIFIIGIDKNSG